MPSPERVSRSLVLTIANPPVNALSEAVLRELADGLASAEADDAIVAIVVRGQGDRFVAGADIARLEQLASGARPTSDAPTLASLIQRIEQGRKPTVAAIDGFALGGGLELALACAARVGTTRARLGLPELRLGLIPGAGGTQRLPRLVGLERALDLMLSAGNLVGDAALEAGLLDELTSAEELTRAAVRRAESIAAGSLPWRRSLADSPESTPTNHAEVVAALRHRYQKRYLNQRQAEACIDAVLTGVLHGAEAGLRRERELFEGLLDSPQARGLLHVFFAERRLARRELPKSRDLSRVLVIGGGTMGTGIGTSLLAAGLETTILEANAERAEAARQRIEAAIEHDLQRGRCDAGTAASRRSRLATTTELSTAADAELVIEAASEDVALKRGLFAELGRRTRDEVVLASNTSTIPIETMADASGSPSRTLGLHFFSPAQVMKLVEVIVTAQTSDQALADALGLVKRLGKLGVTVRSCPGFLVNRVFMPYSQATGWLIDHGVDPYAIDRSLLAFGMPMGPCRMSDLAGIDVGLKAGEVLDAAYAERSYRSVLRRLLVDAGRLGEKAGAGHYRYDAGRAEEDPELASFVERARDEAGRPELVSLTGDAVAEATLFGVVNEAARALAEGIVERAGAVDVASIHGYGFPAYRGGVLFWAEALGLGRVVATLDALSERHQASLFTPSAALREYAAAGGFPR